MKSDEDETALARWSRKKLESRQHIIPIVEEASTEPVALQETAVDNNEAAEILDIDQLCDEDMPDIESLNEDSSYAGFFSKNVSDGLRKMALQKLFHCKSYNFCDGLDDYDGNYTAFEKLDASIITTDMKHRLEIEAQQRLEQLAEADNSQEPDAEPEASEATASPNNETDITEKTIDTETMNKAENKVALPTTENSA